MSVLAPMLVRTWLHFVIKFGYLEGQARTEKRGKGAQARIPREGAQDDRKIVEPEETQARHQQTTSKPPTNHEQDTNSKDTKTRSKPTAKQEQAYSRNVPEIVPKPSQNTPKILFKTSQNGDKKVNK